MLFSLETFNDFGVLNVLTNGINGVRHTTVTCIGHTPVSRGEETVASLPAWPPLGLDFLEKNSRVLIKLLTEIWSRAD